MESEVPVSKQVERASYDASTIRSKQKNFNVCARPGRSTFLLKQKENLWRTNRTHEFDIFFKFVHARRALPGLFGAINLLYRTSVRTVLARNQ